MVGHALAEYPGSVGGTGHFADSAGRAVDLDPHHRGLLQRQHDHDGRSTARCGRSA
jgi:hypothetical protein